MLPVNLSSVSMLWKVRRCGLGSYAAEEFEGQDMGAETVAGGIEPAAATLGLSGARREEADTFEKSNHGSNSTIVALFDAVFQLLAKNGRDGGDNSLYWKKRPPLPAVHFAQR